MVSAVPFCRSDKYFKLKLEFLTGYTIAMVTFYVKKITISCLPIIRHLFHIIIDVSC